MINPEFVKIQVESLFTKLNDLDLLARQTFNEISQIQSECDHRNSDDLSTIKYDHTDLFRDYFKCDMCKKIFKGNPHK